MWGLMGSLVPLRVQLHVEVNDLYLMCSDGLTDLVDDEAIQAILLEANGNIELAANILVRAANELGGKDNISVIIALIKKDFSAEKGWIKNLLGKVKSPKTTTNN